MNGMNMTTSAELFVNMDIIPADIRTAVPNCFSPFLLSLCSTCSKRRITPLSMIALIMMTMPAVRRTGVLPKLENAV